MFEWLCQRAGLTPRPLGVKEANQESKQGGMMSKSNPKRPFRGLDAKAAPRLVNSEAPAVAADTVTVNSAAPGSAAGWARRL